jgi:predicted transcriptional regulator of viral defense system
MPKTDKVIESRVKSIILGHGRGWVFTRMDLIQVGAPDSIGMALLRLSRKNVIRRLARGLYDYPVIHPTLGRIAASADAIAKALACRDAVRIQPAGAYAANILGLSEQIPTRIVFLTDGASRHIKLGKREIVLKRTTPRNIAASGRKSGTIIQALRHLGKNQVNDQVRSIILRQLTAADRKQILKDIKFAPAWVARILRGLAAAPLNP